MSDEGGDRQYGGDSGDSYYHGSYRGYRGRGRGRGGFRRGYQYHQGGYNRGGDRDRYNEHSGYNERESYSERGYADNRGYDERGYGEGYSHRGGHSRANHGYDDKQGYMGSHGYRDGGHDRGDGVNDGDQYRGGSSYRGSHRGGRGYRGNHGHNQHYYKQHRGSGKERSPHDTPRDAETQMKKFDNPWIHMLDITNESHQNVLESRYRELNQVNDEIAKLQSAKVKLGHNLQNLQRLAEKEELNVQISSEKLEEFTLL